MGAIRRDQGRLDELVDTIARAVADNPGIPGFSILLALVYCELERYEEARLAFAPRREPLRLHSHDRVWSSAMTMGAEVASILGDTDAAAVLTADLRPFSGMLARNGTSTFGAIDRYLGLLAMTLGNVDRARMRLRRAGPGDAEHAGELLASALRTARKIGLPTVERQTVSLAASGAPAR